MARPTSSALRHALASVAMLVLFVAALAKAVDIPAFVDTLSTWQFLPAGFRSHVGLMTPMAEATVALLWFLGLARLAACVAAIGLLIVFTGLYVAHAAFGQTPECRCLGALLAFDASVHAAWFVVGRNVALIAALLPCAIFTAGSTALPHSRSQREGPRGFTLIETVISVAIIGLLITLMLPTLASVRDSARQTQTLANLRSHSQVFSSYTIDWNDTLPRFTIPDGRTSLRHGRHVVELEYFDAFNYWSFALADGYYDGKLAHPSMRSPFSAQSDESYIMDYFYTATALANPAFWDPRTRTGPSQWRKVGLHEVQFASNKGLLIDSARWLRTTQPWPWAVDPWNGQQPPSHEAISLMDGSARLIRAGEIRPGYPGGEGPWPGARWRGPRPTMHTIDGVRGMDVN